MKLMTFNLRCNNDPNGHSIAERGFRIRDIIRDYQPDLCGFQEVVPAWLPELEVLEDYDHVLDWRGVDDFEALIIMGRATMNFIDLCDVHKAYFEGENDRLAKAIGFRLTDGKYFADLTNMFTSHCAKHPDAK